MATYDDFDGVYFTIQAIRLFHPEVVGDVDFLVLDNHPDGSHGEAIRDLRRWMPELRYVPCRRPQGTAVRGFLFREATSEFVLCVDSHVMIAPGGLSRLIEYLRTHPGTPDLLQGPLLYDDGASIATHFAPEWRGGMYGTWAGDPRGAAPNAAAFEIPMQGLGLFACRREAWPGLNPRLQGFGGEEGYLHEKIRRRGGRVLCLPFLRWLHRFTRNQRVPYRATWDDMIRNYLLIHDELGWDRAPMVEHFREFLGAEKADAIVRTASEELDGPFKFFDAIYCINLDRATKRWQRVTEQFAKLGILGRVRRFPAIETPTNHHIGCALSHRMVIEEARRQGLDNVLVFEDDVIFTRTAREDLAQSLRELTGRRWWTLYLGGHRWGRTFDLVRGCQALEGAHDLTCSHAIAYNRTIYDRILTDVPATPAAVALWLRAHHGIDQYYARELDGMHLVTCPVVASQGSILGQEVLPFDS
jgi:Glycosyltransferase family 25 (LPS biosynthesis protein)